MRRNTEQMDEAGGDGRDRARIVVAGVSELRKRVLQYWASVAGGSTWWRPRLRGQSCCDRPQPPARIRVALLHPGNLARRTAKSWPGHGRPGLGLVQSGGREECSSSTASLGWRGWSARAWKPVAGDLRATARQARSGSPGPSSWRLPRFASARAFGVCYTTPGTGNLCMGIHLWEL